MKEIKNTYTVSRGSNILRPYFVDGKQIAAIKIYNQSGVVFETNCGWFEHRGDVESIELEKPVKRANKLDFSRKDNFIIKEADDFYPYVKYHLYLHESEFESIEHFQKVVIDNADYIQRANYATLTFKHEFTYSKLNFDKESKKSFRTNEKAKTLTQLNGYYLPRELKEHGKQKERIREKLQKVLHIDYISECYMDEFMLAFEERGGIK